MPAEAGIRATTTIGRVALGPRFRGDEREAAEIALWVELCSDVIPAERSENRNPTHPPLMPAKAGIQSREQ